MNLHATHHHRQMHGMSCAEFDALIKRAAGRCEVCGARPVPLGRQGQAGLYIDHDHAREADPAGCVRGLLCPKCNALVRRVDSGEREATSEGAAYLANPWHAFREEVRDG